VGFVDDDELRFSGDRHLTSSERQNAAHDALRTRQGWPITNENDELLQAEDAFVGTQMFGE
jgi:hypothetical protein